MKKYERVLTQTKSRVLASHENRPCDFLAVHIEKLLTPFYAKLDVTFDEGNYMEEVREYPPVLVILKGQKKDLPRLSMETIILAARRNKYYLVSIEGLSTKQTILTFENK